MRTDLVSRKVLGLISTDRAQRHHTFESAHVFWVLPRKAKPGLEPHVLCAPWVFPGENQPADPRRPSREVLGP